MIKVEEEKIKEEYEKLDLKYYTPKEELYNTISHAAGIPISIIIMTLMLISSENLLKIIVSLCCGILMSLEFLISTLYHGVNKNLKFKLNLRKLDYPSVNLNILGCGAPLCMLYNNIYSYITLGISAIITIISLIGCYKSFRKFRKISVAMTFITGFLLLTAYIVDRSITIIPYCISYIYLAGIALALVASIIFRVKKMYYHTIFHILTLISSTLCMISNYYQIILI